ncbi:hypothetical protein J6590_039136 [Homalodisca vitripennis]|nr:hypothetical protein J6590_039136 [Homalodisca vitripennis]
MKRNKNSANKRYGTTHDAHTRGGKSCGGVKTYSSGGNYHVITYIVTSGWRANMFLSGTNLGSASVQHKEDMLAYNCVISSARQEGQFE